MIFQFLALLWRAFISKKPVVVPVPIPEPQPEPALEPEPIIVQPAPVEEPTSKYLFDTAQNARHSIRVLCDEMGLSLYNKNVITACIEQESNFLNYKSNGTPQLRHNYSKKNPGVLLSTDWGICQINDTPGWHIGPGLAFPSVDYVLANPEKAVRYMITMLKAGKINLWVSYSSGAYLKHMPQ